MEKKAQCNKRMCIFWNGSQTICAFSPDTKFSKYEIDKTELCTYNACVYRLHMGFGWLCGSPRQRIMAQVALVVIEKDTFQCTGIGSHDFRTLELVVWHGCCNLLPLWILSRILAFPQLWLWLFLLLFLCCCFRNRYRHWPFFPPSHWPRLPNEIENIPSRNQQKPTSLILPKHHTEFPLHTVCSQQFGSNLRSAKH